MSASMPKRFNHFPAERIYRYSRFASVLTVGRVVVDGDPERHAETQRLSSAATASGKLTVSGHPSLVPAAMRPVHDEVARLLS